MRFLEAAKGTYEFPRFGIDLGEANVMRLTENANLVPIRQLTCGSATPRLLPIAALTEFEGTCSRDIQLEQPPSAFAQQWPFQ
jgi:hypothetical protein